MESYHLESDERTPSVHFEGSGDLSLSGVSFPQDATHFFKDLLDWMEEYKKDPAETTRLSIDLKAFNIGSSKYLLYLIYHLQEIEREGGRVEIEWVHDAGDEDMIEVGEDYEAMAGIPFHFTTRKPLSPQKELARSASFAGS